MFLKNKKIKIIPAIDILNSQVVRLEQGDFNKVTNYTKDPFLQAKEFESLGFKKLHLVNLDGAKNGKIQNLKLFQTISNKTNLEIDYGGGVKSLEEVEVLLESGIKQVNLGSVLVNNPDQSKKIIKTYQDKIILAIDVKAKKNKPNSLDDFWVYTSGWKIKTKKTLKNLIDQYLVNGFKFLTCTDISKDGMLKGPNFDLYKMILSHYPQISLIASGGLSSLDDILKLDQIGCYGAILGKAYYEKRLNLTFRNEKTNLV